VLALPTLLAAAPSGPPQLTLQGRIHTEHGEQPTQLTVICTQGKGGALSLHLRVPGEHLATFDLDAYEGPGAPASRHPTAHLEVGGKRLPAAKVGGWYTNDGADEPLYFLLGLSSSAGQAGTAASAARALGKAGATLRWIQDNPKPGGPPLVAEFRPMPEDNARVASLTAPCLPRH